MAPDVANKASGWEDIYVKIRPSKARTTFLRTVQCDGKSKPGEQGSQWAGVKFKPLEPTGRGGEVGEGPAASSASLLGERGLGKGTVQWI